MVQSGQQMAMFSSNMERIIRKKMTILFEVVENYLAFATPSMRQHNYNNNNNGNHSNNDNNL
jgi:hypothetical protein